MKETDRFLAPPGSDDHRGDSWDRRGRNPSRADPSGFDISTKWRRRARSANDAGRSPVRPLSDANVVRGDGISIAPGDASSAANASSENQERTDNGLLAPPGADNHRVDLDRGRGPSQPDPSALRRNRSANDVRRDISPPSIDTFRSRSGANIAPREETSTAPEVPKIVVTGTIPGDAENDINTSYESNIDHAGTSSEHASSGSRTPIEVDTREPERSNRFLTPGTRDPDRPRGSSWSGRGRDRELVDPSQPELSPNPNRRRHRSHSTGDVPDPRSRSLGPFDRFPDASVLLGDGASTAAVETARDHSTNEDRRNRLQVGGTGETVEHPRDRSTSEDRRNRLQIDGGGSGTPGGAEEVRATEIPSGEHSRERNSEEVRAVEATEYVHDVVDTDRPPIEHEREENTNNVRYDDRRNRRRNRGRDAHDVRSEEETISADDARNNDRYVRRGHRENYRERGTNDVKNEDRRKKGQRRKKHKERNTENLRSDRMTRNIEDAIDADRLFRGHAGRDEETADRLPSRQHREKDAVEGEEDVDRINEAEDERADEIQRVMYQRMLTGDRVIDGRRHVAFERIDGIRNGEMPYRIRFITNRIVEDDERAIGTIEVRDDDTHHNVYQMERDAGGDEETADRLPSRQHRERDAVDGEEDVDRTNEADNPRNDEIQRVMYQRMPTGDRVVDGRRHVAFERIDGIRNGEMPYRIRFITNRIVEDDERAIGTIEVRDDDTHHNVYQMERDAGGDEETADGLPSRQHRERDAVDGEEDVDRTNEADNPRNDEIQRVMYQRMLTGDRVIDGRRHVAFERIDGIRNGEMPYRIRFITNRIVEDDERAIGTIEVRDDNTRHNVYQMERDAGGDEETADGLPSRQHRERDAVDGEEDVDRTNEADNPRNDEIQRVMYQRMPTGDRVIDGRRHVAFERIDGIRNGEMPYRIRFITNRIVEDDERAIGTIEVRDDNTRHNVYQMERDAGGDEETADGLPSRQHRERDAVDGEEDVDRTNEADNPRNDEIQRVMYQRMPTGDRVIDGRRHVAFERIDGIRNGEMPYRIRFITNRIVEDDERAIGTIEVRDDNTRHNVYQMERSAEGRTERRIAQQRSLERVVRRQVEGRSPGQRMLERVMRRRTRGREGRSPGQRMLERAVVRRAILERTVIRRAILERTVIRRTIEERPAMLPGAEAPQPWGVERSRRGGQEIWRILWQRPESYHRRFNIWGFPV